MATGIRRALFPSGHSDATGETASPPRGALEMARLLSSWALRQHWPLLAILGVALALRLTSLFPNALYGDEAEYAAVARSLASDPRALEYPDIEQVGPAPFVSQPPATLYLFAASSWVFGSVEVGGLVLAMLFGLGTIALTYGIGFLVHGPFAGAAAALFVAVTRMHVNLSRQVALDGALIFFTALTVFLFLVWERWRAPRWAIATGVAAAFATFTKLYGGLIVVALVVGLVYLLRRARGERVPQLTLLRDGALMAAPVLVAGLLYLGLLIYLQALEDLWEKLAWQFGRVLGATASVAPSLDDSRPWHWYITSGRGGLPETMGLPIVLLAFAGAVHVASRRLGGPSAGPIALLAWPAAILLFFMASGRKQWFYPAAAAPGIALLAGIAAAELWRSALASFSRWTAGPRSGGVVRGVFLMVLVLLPAGLPAVAVATSLADRGGGYGAGVQEAAIWIHVRDPDAAQVGTILGRFTLHYYNGQPTYHAYTPHDFVDAEIEAGRVRYVVDDHYQPIDADQEWIEALVARHGGRLVHSYADEPDRVMVRVYEVGARDPRSTGPRGPGPDP